MNTSTWILLSIYTAAAICEVYGLVRTAALYLSKDDDKGLFTIHQPEGWEAIQGPLFIVLGVLLGLGGNIAALFMQ